MTVHSVMIMATEPTNANRSPAGPPTTRPSTVKKRHCRTARGQSAVRRMRHGLAAANSRNPRRTVARASSKEIKCRLPPGPYGHPVEEHRPEYRVDHGQPDGGAQGGQVDPPGRRPGQKL